MSKKLLRSTLLLISSDKSIWKSSKKSQMKNAKENSFKPSIFNSQSKEFRIFIKVLSTPKKSQRKKFNQFSIKSTINYDSLVTSLFCVPFLNYLIFFHSSVLSRILAFTLKLNLEYWQHIYKIMYRLHQTMRITFIKYFINLNNQNITGVSEYVNYYAFYFYLIIKLIHLFLSFKFN